MLDVHALEHKYYQYLCSVSNPRNFRNSSGIDPLHSFRQWHIHNGFQFFLSFLAIVALGCSYEWLRDLQRRYDRKVAIELLKSGKGKNAVSQSTGAIALQADEDELIPNSKATQELVSHHSTELFIT